MVVRSVSFRRLVRNLRSTTYATHGLYMYPAKFIPHIVRYAITRLTEPGDWVFDPFAGYGTVAVEATLTGRNAVLWDLNPITRILTYASIYTGRISLRDFEVDWNYGKPFHPQWNNIKYWYPDELYDAISRIWGYWHHEVHGRARDASDKARAYLVAIALFKVSRFFSYSDEKIAKLYKSRYAVEKIKGLLGADWREKMRSMYWKHARTIVDKVMDYQRHSPKKTEVIVRTSERTDGKLRVWDALNEKLDRAVKLMVTSPPYLQAQEYIRSFKLELAWLGYTGEDLRELARHEIPYNNPPPVEIRSTVYRDMRERIAGLENPKLLQLYDAYFRSLIRFLNNNHSMIETMAIFVGPVKIRGIRVPIDEILREHLESLGWKHEETLVDKIVSRRLFRTGVNPATGLKDERTPTEHLLIMRRER